MRRIDLWTARIAAIAGIVYVALSSGGSGRRRDRAAIAVGRAHRRAVLHGVAIATCAATASIVVVALAAGSRPADGATVSPCARAAADPRFVAQPAATVDVAR